MIRGAGVGWSSFWSRGLDNSLWWSLLELIHDKNSQEVFSEIIHKVEICVKCIHKILDRVPWLQNTSLKIFIISISKLLLYLLSLLLKLWFLKISIDQWSVMILTTNQREQLEVSFEYCFTFEEEKLKVNFLFLFEHHFDGPLNAT